MIKNVEKVLEQLQEIKKTYRHKIESHIDLYNKLFLDTETKAEYLIKISLNSIKQTYENYIIVQKYDYGVFDLDVFIELTEYNQKGVIINE